MSQDIQAVSYAVGMSIAGSLMQQELEEINPTVLAEAIADVFSNKTLKMNGEEANNLIQSYIQERSEKKFAVYKEEGENFLAQNKAKSGITTTTTGLQYEVIEQGNGVKPGPTSSVTVHYHGTLIDGTVFDSSVERNQPATFGVNQVIKGWTEALQLMETGSKYRLYIPENLAYGAQPHPNGPIKPFMALIFDVELISVN